MASILYRSSYSRGGNISSQTELTAIVEGTMLVPIAAAMGQLKWIRFKRPQDLLDMQEFDDASRGPWGAGKLLLRPRKA